jgi:poly-gamma-glutamate synthesis protein (capsule biosynthesis protein)
MCNLRKLLAFVLLFFPVCLSAESNITLLFGGDIMAHDHNYNIKDFDDIWKDVKPIIQKADLAFANIEAPVDSTKPVSSFPRFNMSVDYLEAVIKAGFSVFSMCNNHSNDQGLKGIQETIRSCDELTRKYEESGRSIYFAGLKRSPSDGFSYSVIEKNGWRILFFPVTESLNQFDAFKTINYISSDVQVRQRFASYLKKLRGTVSCDLFILSLHTNEPEYVREVSDAQKKFYENLVASGVDIVWANHAHIIKEREIIVDKKTGRQALIMYSNGNTVSGQRTSPNLTMEYPDTKRDNTGDGLLYEVVLSRAPSGKIRITGTKPHYITTYITPKREFVLKPMNEEFIRWLKETRQPKWAGYIERRMKINLK